MRFRFLLFCSVLFAACSQAQPEPTSRNPAVSIALRQRWVDSVYSRLNEDERIGQMFMVAAYSGGDKYNAPAIEALLRKHQLGGLIFMQGGPARQALLTNKYQQMAQVPLLLSMDAEWGLGMRLDSIKNLPKQMTLGAANDTALAYEMGKIVAYQFKRIGAHVNFAPVADVNNNPANPVINARSFGEDKMKVTRLAIAYMKGMQDNGIMACAKHFPGHGDVSVDSHLDLPVISKSRAQLDTLELYPFRAMIAAGVQSVMVAHLAVPVLESAVHVPTTLSKNTVTNLLKGELGFHGLTFTDALNMEGVAKYYEPGEVDVRAFLAGNDFLLISQDVPTAIAKIKAAVATGKVTRQDLEARVKKILTAKYDLGLNQMKPVSTVNIVKDLNQYTYDFNMKVAKASITVVRDRNKMLPLLRGKKVLTITVGRNCDTAINSKEPLYGGYYPAGFCMGNGKDGTSVEAIKKMITTKTIAALGGGKFDAVVVNVEGLSFYPGKSYGLNEETLAFLNWVTKQPDVIVAVMGNAYALKYVCDAGTLICSYEDNAWTRDVRNQVLGGEIKAKGKLPVTPPCLK